MQMRYYGSKSPFVNVYSSVFQPTEKNTKHYCKCNCNGLAGKNLSKGDSSTYSNNAWKKNDHSKDQSDHIQRSEKYNLDKNVNSSKIYQKDSKNISEVGENWNAATKNILEGEIRQNNDKKLEDALSEAKIDIDIQNVHLTTSYGLEKEQTKVIREDFKNEKCHCISNNLCKDVGAKCSSECDLAENRITSMKTKQIKTFNDSIDMDHCLDEYISQRSHRFSGSTDNIAFCNLNSKKDGRILGLSKDRSNSMKVDMTLPNSANKEVKSICETCCRCEIQEDVLLKYTRPSISRKPLVQAIDDDFPNTKSTKICTVIPRNCHSAVGTLDEFSFDLYDPNHGPYTGKLKLKYPTDISQINFQDQNLFIHPNNSNEKNTAKYISSQNSASMHEINHDHGSKRNMYSKNAQQSYISNLVPSQSSFLKHTENCKDFRIETEYLQKHYKKEKILAQNSFKHDSNTVSNCLDRTDTHISRTNFTKDDSCIGNIPYRKFSFSINTSTLDDSMEHNLSSYLTKFCGNKHNCQNKEHEYKYKNTQKLMKIPKATRQSPAKEQQEHATNNIIFNKPKFSLTKSFNDIFTLNKTKTASKKKQNLESLLDTMSNDSESLSFESDSLDNSHFLQDCDVNSKTDIHQNFSENSQQPSRNLINYKPLQDSDSLKNISLPDMHFCCNANNHNADDVIEDFHKKPLHQIKLENNDTVMGCRENIEDQIKQTPENFSTSVNYGMYNDQQTTVSQKKPKISICSHEQSMADFRSFENDQNAARELNLLRRFSRPADTAFNHQKEYHELSKRNKNEETCLNSPEAYIKYSLSQQDESVDTIRKDTKRDTRKNFEYNLNDCYFPKIDSKAEKSSDYLQNSFMGVISNRRPSFEENIHKMENILAMNVKETSENLQISRNSSVNSINLNEIEISAIKARRPSTSSVTSETRKPLLRHFVLDPKAKNIEKFISHLNENSSCRSEDSQDSNTSSGNSTAHSVHKNAINVDEDSVERFKRAVDNYVNIQNETYKEETGEKDLLYTNLDASNNSGAFYDAKQKFDTTKNQYNHKTNNHSVSILKPDIHVQSDAIPLESVIKSDPVGSPSFNQRPKGRIYGSGLFLDLVSYVSRPLSTPFVQDSNIYTSETLGENKFLDVKQIVAAKLRNLQFEKTKVQNNNAQNESDSSTSDETHNVFAKDYGFRHQESTYNHPKVFQDENYNFTMNSAHKNSETSSGYNLSAADPQSNNIFYPSVDSSLSSQSTSDSLKSQNEVFSSYNRDCASTTSQNYNDIFVVQKGNIISYKNAAKPASYNEVETDDLTFENVCRKKSLAPIHDFIAKIYPYNRDILNNPALRSKAKNAEPGLDSHDSTQISNDTQNKIQQHLSKITKSSDGENTTSLNKIPDAENTKRTFSDSRPYYRSIFAKENLTNVSTCPQVSNISCKEPVFNRNASSLHKDSVAPPENIVKSSIISDTCENTTADPKNYSGKSSSSEQSSSDTQYFSLKQGSSDSSNTTKKSLLFASASENLKNTLMKFLHQSHKTKLPITNICLSASMDPEGSRFIQNKIFDFASQEISWFYSEVSNDLLRLCKDLFGNYVIQKIISYDSRTPLKQNLFSTLSSKAFKDTEFECHISILSQIGILNEKIVQSGKSEHSSNVCLKTISFDIMHKLQRQAIILSTDNYGCRVIQKILECDLGIFLYIDKISSNLKLLMDDSNGNHVVQKAADIKLAQNMNNSDIKRFFASKNTSSLKPSVSDTQISIINEKEHNEGCKKFDNALFTKIKNFRIELISLFTKNKTKFLNHKYGCRVIQKIIENCSDSELDDILTHCILDNIDNIIMDQYGNYVLQHVLTIKRNSEEKNSKIEIAKLSKSKNVDIRELVSSQGVQRKSQWYALKVLKRFENISPQKLYQYSTHKFASNVIEKVILHSIDVFKTQLVAEVNKKPVIILLACDKYGNYVVQRVLEKNCPNIADILNINSLILKKSEYASHILAKIQRYSA